MRLKKIQDYLRRKGKEYHYTEEDGCGSIGWEHRGLMYYVWEFPEVGAESNVKAAGRMEDYFGDYEEKIIEVIEGWG